MIEPKKKEDGMTRLAVLLTTLFVSLMVVSGCANPKLDIIGMPKAPTHGPAEYIMGWKDGCQTGMTAYSTNFLRSRYHIEIKGEMMDNLNYNKGWRAANRYCSYYVSRHLSIGLIDFDTPGLKEDLRDDDVWSHIERKVNFFQRWEVPW